jgi:hypothetical protein
MPCWSIQASRQSRSKAGWCIVIRALTARPPHG